MYNEFIMSWETINENKENLYTGRKSKIKVEEYERKQNKDRYEKMINN